MESPLIILGPQAPSSNFQDVVSIYLNLSIPSSMVSMTSELGASSRLAQLEIEESATQRLLCPPDPPHDCGPAAAAAAAAAAATNTRLLATNTTQHMFNVAVARPQHTDGASFPRLLISLSVSFHWCFICGA